MDNKESKYDKSGINKNTYEILFSDNDNIPENERQSIKDLYVITIIQMYTKFREKSIFSKLLKIYFEKKNKVDFSKIKFNEKTKEYEYEFQGEVYTFDKLSNIFDSKKIKKELESDKRYNQCHDKSLKLSLCIPESYIVTGYIKEGEGKYLHSILEMGNENNKYAIDYTKNLIMPKKQYVKLTRFEELERISDMEYLQDLQKIYNIPEINVKVYTAFRKELIKDLEKNNFIFEKDESIEKKLNEIRKQKSEEIKEIKERQEQLEKEKRQEIDRQELDKERE